MAALIPALLVVLSVAAVICFVMGSVLGLRSRMVRAVTSPGQTGEGPTDEAVENLARLIYARWQDTTENLGVSTPELGMRQARWHAREMLLKERRSTEKAERGGDSN